MISHYFTLLLHSILSQASIPIECSEMRPYVQHILKKQGRVPQSFSTIFDPIHSSSLLSLSAFSEWDNNYMEKESINE